VIAHGRADREGLDALGRIAAGKSKAAIDRVFSPEFRNRLDAIVTFRSLTPR
jgi:ATP-dependent Clp protease ATP-binding subunit ClpA